ncbi:MAG: carboxypeptidase regulatory-like domain-containing protein [Candidatus Acidiferrales bacterium]
MRDLKLALVILVALLILPVVAIAQSVASITGVVTDASGAVVPGASIKVTNTQTGASLFGKTADDGSYRIFNISPGPAYSLTVKKDGFETLVINNLYLSVGAPTTRDVQLQLGEITQTIEVTVPGGAGSLDTTDATIGTVVEGNRVQDLPSLFVNNASQFLELAPGVQSTGNDSQTGVVTGTRADQTNITLDGLDVNDQRLGGAFTTAVNTPLDAIQEISTIVGGDDASYGHSAGAQVELVTKSGTNQFHGEAFDFNRVTALAANNYFNNLEGIPIPPLIRNQFGGDIGGPILKNKLFFFFSYNGLRAKTSQEINDVVPLAALGNGELNYINDGASCGPSSNIVSTPSCISTTPATGPGSLASLDPQGVGADSKLLSFLASRPYATENNFSVGDLINTAGYLFTAPANGRENTFVGKIDYQLNSKHALFARGTWDRSIDDDDVNFLIKVFPGDPSPISATVDHSRSWVAGDTWVISPTMANKISFGETDQFIVFPLTSKPNFPNLLDFFFNGNVITPPYDDLADGNTTFNEQLPVVPVYELRDAFTWTKSSHTLQFGGVLKPTIFKSGNLTDYSTYDVGLGGQISQLDPTLRPADIASNSVATTEWDTLFPLSLGRIATVTGGFNYNLAGAPLPQGTIPVRDYHATEYEFYAQDVWKIRSDLTVTAGLRWQFHNPLAEIHGFEAVPNISPEKIFAIRQADAAAGIEGPDAVPLITYSLGGPANHGPDYYQPDYHNFAPRIGLAYSPFGGDSFFGRLLGNRKTSIRAGFSINYDDNLIGQGFELDETSFLFSNSTEISNGAGGDAAALLNDPRFSVYASLPAAPAAAPTPRPFTPNLDSSGVPIGFNTGNGVGPNGPFFNFDPNYKTPYEISFSLGAQRELPHDWLVDVSYFGKIAHRLPAIGDVGQTLNFKDAASGQFLYTAFGAVQKSLQASGGDFFTVPNQMWFENQMTAAAVTSGFGTCANEGAALSGGALTTLSCTQLAAALASAVWSDGDVSSTLVSLADIQLDGDPEHGLIPLNAGQLAQDGAAGFIGNYGSSSYNALLVRLNHRMSHDFTMEFDYAYSHSLDNDSDIQNNLVTFTGTGEAEVCDLRNLHVCRSNSNFDATHTVAADFDYGLPFGQGKWLDNGSSKLLNEVIGGWSVSGIVTAHTGFPFSVGSGTFPIDFTQVAPAVFIGNQSDLKAGVHVVPVPGSAPEIQYFSNPTNAQDAFTFPFGGGTGNRNEVRGPGYWNVDFAILKSFAMPWSENHKLEFRAEGFNLFNHVNFAPPSASILSPGNFGALSSTENDARQFQLALKYSF